MPKPGDPGSETLEGRSQRVEDRRRRHLADRIVRSGDQPLHRRHRQPVSDLRPAVPARRQSLHELGRRARRRHRQARLVLPVHAERLVGLRRSRRAHAVRHEDRRHEAQGRQPLRAQRVLLHARSHQRQVHQGREVRQRLELDQGHRSRRPASRSSTARSSTCSSTTRRRARCAATARSARARRGTAASRTSRSRSTRSRTSPTASAPKAASRRTAPRSASLSARRAASTPRRASRASTAATCTTAR